MSHADNRQPLKWTKIFIAQKSYCACGVVSLVIIRRSKYYCNFILNRTRSGREILIAPRIITCLLSVRDWIGFTSTQYRLYGRCLRSFPACEHCLCVDSMLTARPSIVISSWMKSNWLGRRLVIWSWRSLRSTPTTLATTRAHLETPSASMRRQLYSPFSVRMPCRFIFLLVQWQKCHGWDNSSF